MKDFKKIYTENKKKVYFFVKKFIPNDDHIEDVVQEIFIHLWKYRDQLTTIDIIDAIIYKTAKQEISNFYRKSKHPFFNEIDENKLNDTESSADIDDDYYTRHLERIKELLDEIPERSREIFLRNKLDNCSYSRIAEEEQISKTAVKKHVQKVISYIEKNLRKTVF